MNRWDEIEILITYDPTPSINYWNKLLRYFDKNKEHLITKQIQEICNECERCRLYWNEDKLEIITKEEKKIPIQKKGLNIRREDVNPNIYFYLEQRKRIEQQEQNADIIIFPLQFNTTISHVKVEETLAFQ